MAPRVAPSATRRLFLLGLFACVLNSCAALSIFRPTILPLVARGQSISVTVPGTGLADVTDIRMRSNGRPSFEDQVYLANRPSAPCQAAADGTSITCSPVGPFNYDGYLEVIAGNSGNWTEWTAAGRIDARIAASSTEFFIDGAGFISPLAISLSLSGASSTSLSSISCAPLDETRIRCASSNGLPSSGLLSAAVSFNGQPASNFVSFAHVDPVVSSSVQNMAMSSTSIIIHGFGFGALASQTVSVALSPSPAQCTSVSVRENGRVMECAFTERPTIPGPMYAQVTLNDRNSGEGVQVATVVFDPIVTNSSLGISTRASKFVLTGLHFGDRLDELTVVLSSGSCSPSSISPNGDSIECTFNVLPLVGPLFATVSRAGATAPTALVGEVALPPLLTSRPDIYLHISERTFTIFGQNFYVQNTSGNLVTLNSNIACAPFFVSPAGDRLQCTVDSATLPPNVFVSGTAIYVTSFQSNGISAPANPVLIATLEASPVPTATTKSLLFGSTQLLAIEGRGFSAVLSENMVSVVLGDNQTAITCLLVSVSVSLIQCQPTTTWSVMGPVWARVTSFGLAQESGVQVPFSSGFWFKAGTVRDRPQIVANNAKIPISSSSLTIRGSYFSDGPIDANLVALYQYGATTPGSCSILSATPDTIECEPTGLTFRVGPLSATVTVDGIAMSSSVVVPVQIAELDTVPAVSPSRRSIPLNATSVAISGSYFSPTPRDNFVQLMDSSDTLIDCNVTQADEGHLICTLSSRASQGPLRVVNIRSHDMINTTEVVVATVLPFPKVFLPEQLDYDSTFGSLTTVTISGSDFSTDASDVRVEFTSGSCTSVVLASNDTIVCSVDGLLFEGGVLSARVTVLDGVSSSFVPILRLRPTIISSITPLPINSKTLVIHGFHFSKNQSRLRVDLDRFTTCNLTSATTSRIVCTLRDQPDMVGPLLAVVTLRQRDAITGSIAVYLSDTAVVASIVPVVFSVPEEDLRLISADTSIISIGGVGFSSRPDYNRIQLLPGGSSCTVLSLTSLSVTCQVLPEELHGGILLAHLSVYAEDVAQWFSAIQPIAIAKIQPIVNWHDDQVPVVETVLQITGLGFSTNPADVNVFVYPHGQCETSTTNTTMVLCRLSGTDLGPLFAEVSVRGTTSDMVQIANVIIPLPPPSSLSPHMIAVLRAMEVGDEPLSRNGPVDGGVYHVQMVAGSIIGMILMILMAIPLIALIMYVFYLKQKEQGPSSTPPAPASPPVFSPSMSPSTIFKAASEGDKDVSPPTLPVPAHAPAPVHVAQIEKIKAMHKPPLIRSNSDISDSEMSREDDDEVLPDDLELEPDVDESLPDEDDGHMHQVPVVSSTNTSFSEDSFSIKEPAAAPSARVQSLPIIKKLPVATVPNGNITQVAVAPVSAAEEKQPEEDPSSQPPEEENFDLPEDDDDEDDEREREYLASIAKLRQQSVSARAEQPPPPTVTVSVVTASSTSPAVVVPGLKVATATPLRSALKVRKEIPPSEGPVTSTPAAEPQSALKRKVSFFGVAASPASPTTPEPQQPEAVVRKLAFEIPAEPAHTSDDHIIPLDDNSDIM